jgi:hypothetical protein
LRLAILTRQQVVGLYGGHVREFCPHVLGRKQGEPRCLVYQFGGSSQTGPITPRSPDNWRCLKVDQLEVIQLRPGPWFSGPSHERDQRCVDLVEIDSEKPETLRVAHTALTAAAPTARGRSPQASEPGPTAAPPQGRSRVLPFRRPERTGKRARRH